MYSEIYKPITEGIKSQKEELSSQLKALPGIKEHLESLGDEMKDIQTYQGLPQLFKEPQPITWSPEEAEELLREFIKKKGKITEISKEPTEEEVKNLLEDYEREKMRIAEKPLPQYIKGIMAKAEEDRKNQTVKLLEKKITKKLTKAEKRIINNLRDEADNMSNYKDSLDDIIRSKKYKKKGKGTRHHNPYKVSPNGQYGDLLIDLNKLYGQNKLIAKDQRTGKEVINVKVDNDFVFWPVSSGP